MSHWTGKFSVVVIDTSPGAGGPLAPPDGWQGDDVEYTELIRRRWRENPAARQQILVASLLYRSITGPYAAPCAAILKSVAEHGGRSSTETQT